MTLAAALPSSFDIARLTAVEQLRLIELLNWNEKRQSQRLFYSMFPDDDITWQGAGNDIFDTGATIFARHKYPRHLEFFQASKTHNEIAAMCGNRVSKTVGMGGYAVACHLTGLYPEWWPGRRFTTPTDWWAAGDTNETTRDIIQATMLGKVDAEANRKIVTGTGLIPGHLLGRYSWKSGVESLVDTIQIRHVTGGWSRLGLKSYEQGRKAFQGTRKHGIWLDEQPPADVYDECKIRTMTTGGLVLLTFTPLEGLTEVVLAFLPENMKPGGKNRNKISPVDRAFAGQPKLAAE
jgi:phage terminase large subunit-like protein